MLTRFERILLRVGLLVSILVVVFLGLRDAGLLVSLGINAAKPPAKPRGDASPVTVIEQTTPEPLGEFLGRNALPIVVIVVFFMGIAVAFYLNYASIMAKFAEREGSGRLVSVKAPIPEGSFEDAEKWFATAPSFDTEHAAAHDQFTAVMGELSASKRGIDVARNIVGWAGYCYHRLYVGDERQRGAFVSLGADLQFALTGDPRHLSAIRRRFLRTPGPLLDDGVQARAASAYIRRAALGTALRAFRDYEAALAESGDDAAKQAAVVAEWKPRMTLLREAMQRLDVALAKTSKTPKMAGVTPTHTRVINKVTDIAVTSVTKAASGVVSVLDFGRRLVSGGPGTADVQATAAALADIAPATPPGKPRGYTKQLSLTADFDRIHWLLNRFYRMSDRDAAYLRETQLEGIAFQPRPDLMPSLPSFRAGLEHDAEYMPAPGIRPMM